MLHHVLEHVPDPVETLDALRGCLSGTGAILVRVPVADSAAARQYGSNWVQLDAPRHIMIPTTEGMSRLAARCDLRVESVFYDSRGFQFWGSEQYSRGIPLRSPRSYAEKPSESVFSPDDIKRFERDAQTLNRRRDGDSAGFILLPA